MRKPLLEAAGQLAQTLLLHFLASASAVAVAAGRLAWALLLLYCFCNSALVLWCVLLLPNVSEKTSCESN